MTDKFDPDWKHGHVTRDGRRARVLPERLDNPHFPLVVFITEQSNGIQHAQQYSLDGDQGMPSPHRGDLLNAPAPKRVWEGHAVIDPDWGDPLFYRELSDAKSIAALKKDRRIAPVRIEFEA